MIDTKYLLPFLVYDISLVIHKITSLIYLSFLLVNAFLIDNFSFSVSVKLSHHILNRKSLSFIVVETRDVFFYKLLLVQNNVWRGSGDEISWGIHVPSFAVYSITFLVLSDFSFAKQFWLSIFNVKISLKFEWVEVVSVIRKWKWKFSFV